MFKRSLNTLIFSQRIVFFFFSSRRRHTRSDRDWSSDVCSSDLISGPGATLWGANAVNGVINVITKDAGDTPGFLLAGGGGTEQHGFGTVRYGATLGSTVRARIYGRGFDRDATVLPGGPEAADDWYLGQGGFRMDWEAS